MNITKEIFVNAINALQKQWHLDKCNADLISQVFTGDVYKYNNDLLATTIIELLRLRFPKDENGHCELSHFCYSCNFGKISEEEYMSPEDLWYQLTKNDQIDYDGATNIMVRGVMEVTADHFPKATITDSVIDYGTGVIPEKE